MVRFGKGDCLFKFTSQALFLISFAMMCTATDAQQAERTITFRMLDSKTGKAMSPTKFQVTVNTKDYSHLETFSPDKSGIGGLVVKGDVAQLSIQALYDPGDHIFVNCDSVKDKLFYQSHWYAVPEIFTTGVVAPNKCSKLTAVARPGEFVFFVRHTNWYENLTE